VTAVESRAGPAEIRALLAEGAYVDEIAGQVPLVWQLSRGHAAVVRLLLDGGAAVNQAMADIGGKPLFVAADGHCSRAGLPRACAMPDRLWSRCERRKERQRRHPGPPLQKDTTTSRSFCSRASPSRQRACERAGAQALRVTKSTARQKTGSTEQATSRCARRQKPAHAAFRFAQADCNSKNYARQGQGRTYTPLRLAPPRALLGVFPPQRRTKGPSNWRVRWAHLWCSRYFKLASEQKIRHWERDGQGQQKKTPKKKGRPNDDDA
jgi:hypothetical protein